MTKTGLLLVLLLAGATNTLAADLMGQVVISGNAPGDALSQTVVYFQPAGEKGTVEVPAAPLVMSMVRKQFDPRVLAVPVGATVAFPNLDPILHNAFSTSRYNAFDAGLYGEGPGKQLRFDRSGLVRVFCNVHRSMVGYILVLDTPWYAKVQSDGSFLLSDLPDGPGTLYLWNERAKPIVKEIDLPTAEAVELELRLNARRVPRHKNKHGRDYKRRTGRRY